MLLGRVRQYLADGQRPPTASRVAAALRAEGSVLGSAAILDLVAAMRAELVGVGPLQPLLADETVTDILVNGPSEVWVDRGEGLRLAPVTFADEAAIHSLAQRLALAAGRRLDLASPFVDARLPGGVRLHAVVPPISPAGTCLSLRVRRRRPFTLDQLVRAGTLSVSLAATVSAVVASRRSLLVTGGTGTGKTTVLATVLGLVDPVERIIIIEESGELAPAHPHVIRLEARPPNVEGQGAITLRDLVRQALRMRPDRLVVGEVRGAEVADLLAALNTGHDGGAATLHANEVVDVAARLEALGAMAGLDPLSLASQASAGVDVVVHLARSPAGPRRLQALGVTGRGADGRLTVTVALDVGPDGEPRPGPGLLRLEHLLAERQ
ncbi:MAG: TadA family conjugal transfer-associated ATPase [Actinomycetes bacterium]